MINIKGYQIIHETIPGSSIIIKSYLEKRDKKMTNARKYLKENVDIHTLSKEIISFMNGVVEDKYIGMIEDFFNCPVKPILSKDEKVILKSIDKKYTHIGRDEDGLFIEYYFDDCENDCVYFCFNKLFEFIELGETYKISSLLEE